MAQYWWVNQGQSYAPERREGLLWAPYRTTDGKAGRSHWDSMDDVQVGDRVLHYTSQQIVAVSEVSEAAVRSPRPASLPAEAWDRDGRLVRTRYFDAASPVHRNEIPLDWRRAEPTAGPFQTDQAVKLGYLYPLSRTFVDRFWDSFGERFDRRLPLRAVEVEVPVEARGGAVALLQRLIGAELATVDGLGVRIVAVGQQLGLASVDGAEQARTSFRLETLERLLTDLAERGEVQVAPGEFGGGAAILQAVLLSLPGAGFDSSRETVRLSSVDPAAVSFTRDDDRTVTFEGDTDVLRGGLGRGEQAALRRSLFGRAQIARCAICDDEYPVRFLHAAHIKRRAVCSDTEKRDFANVAMPACVFGCDALFENGYLAVADDGRVVVAATRGPAALARRLRELEGRSCSAFGPGSANYFDWHRANVLRRPEAGGW